MASPEADSERDRLFELLYRRHARDVYGFSLGLVRSSEEAEDVTQTAFLNAFRALEDGTRPERPRAWLLSIARNVCRGRFRSQSRRPREVALDGEVTPVASGGENPTLGEIGSALRQLSPNQRAALLLRELEGLSYTELQARLGLSRSAVEGLLFRARSTLREQLQLAEQPLSCGEAGTLVERQLDGRLAEGERAGLRAHLRTCPECAGAARSARARRGRRLGALAFVPFPLAPVQRALHGARDWLACSSATAKVATGAVGVAMLGGGTASLYTDATHRVPHSPAAAPTLPATERRAPSRETVSVERLAEREIPARPLTRSTRGAGSPRGDAPRFQVQRALRVDRVAVGSERPGVVEVQASSRPELRQPPARVASEIAPLPRAVPASSPPEATGSPPETGSPGHAPPADGDEPALVAAAPGLPVPDPDADPAPALPAADPALVPAGENEIEAAPSETEIELFEPEAPAAAEEPEAPAAAEAPAVPPADSKGKPEHGDQARKVTVAHPTGSETNPVVEISVGAQAGDHVGAAPERPEKGEPRETPDSAEEKARQP